VLLIRIQPDEGISLRFGSKVPGPDFRIRGVRMDFSYGSAFGDDTADAYERLLLDSMIGDSTLFARRDEVELAWELVDGVRAAWVRGTPAMAEYEAGTWGPKEAEEMIERDGHLWRRL